MPQFSQPPPDETLTLRSVDWLRQTWLFTQTGEPTGGDFTILFPGNGTTSAIAFDASQEDIQAVCDSTLNCTVVGNATEFTVVTDDYVEADLPTIDTNSLTGGTSPDYTITEIQVFHEGQQTPGFSVVLGDAALAGLRVTTRRENTTGKRTLVELFAASDGDNISSSLLSIEVTADEVGAAQCAITLSGTGASGAGSVVLSALTAYGAKSVLVLKSGQTDPPHILTDALGNVLYQITATGAVDLLEQTNPAAPAANNARLYARDSGGGKTQLVVEFPSGDIQVIKTEV